MSTQLYVLLEGPPGTWGPGSSDAGPCSLSRSHSVVPPSTQSQGSALCLHLQPPPQCHCHHQWKSFSPMKENNLFEIGFFWRQDTTSKLRTESSFVPVLHRSRMRWKQDILNDARMTLSVCIHTRHSLKTQTQHPSLQRWRQEELKGPRGIGSAGLLYPHRQLNHHVDDSFSACRKVKTFREPNPADAWTHNSRKALTFNWIVM